MARLHGDVTKSNTIPGAPTMDATMGRYSVLLLMRDSNGSWPTEMLDVSGRFTEFVLNFYMNAHLEQPVEVTQAWMQRSLG